MTPMEQKKAATAFVDGWKAAEGNEQREVNSFWIKLCSQVLGIADPTQRLNRERKVKGRRIDVFYEDMGTPIESKPRGVNLDVSEQRGTDRHGNPRMVTPYEQARWHTDHTALDAAVEAAYGVNIGGNEEKTVAHLFKLYTEMNEGRQAMATHIRLKENPCLYQL